jgi:hypothetical protein
MDKRLDTAEMSTRNESDGNSRRSGSTGLMLLALLALSLLGTVAEAGETSAWRLEPALDIRTATYFEYSGGASKTYPAIGAEFSVQLSSPEKPFTAGLFANYEMSTLAQARRTQLIGNWISYRYGRWKLSTVTAHYSSNQVNGLWMQASKLQFELRPGHKLAVEAIGAIGGGAPAMQLAYSTNLTRQASLSIKIGLGSNRGRDFGASTKFVWNVY